MQGTSLKFRYLDLRPIGGIGGRGNVVRLYMLSHKIKFEEELVPLSEWQATEKAKTAAECNPAGQLPVVEVDGKPIAEHLSICRYLARKTGCYGGNPEMDRLVDAAADANADWRHAFVNGVFAKPEGDPATKEYIKKRPNFYRTTEWYWNQREDKTSPFLAGGPLPSFADVAVFNQLRDELLTIGMGDLSEYPAMREMYEAVESIPEVASWIESWDAAVAALAP